MHPFPLTTLPTVLLAGVLLGACGGDRETDRQPPEPPPAAPEYVSSRACAECHEKEYEKWLRSHHDLAMEPATEGSVLGDFEDASVEHLGVTSRFFRRDGAFIVNTEGPDGEMHDYEVLYTFGVTPLQQYLVEFPGGRMQCLRVTWDSVRNEWFHLYPDERLPPDDQLHWTRLYQNWNMMCAECHSTALEKNYDVESDSYDTTWKEIDVGCDSCHGPGSAHVEMAEAWGDFIPKGIDLELTVTIDPEDPVMMLNVCAPCHSRRQPQVHAHEPGASFHDDYRLETLRADLYHVDGQILDEVYVTGSFLQSKMHVLGVTCSDCHDPHSLELRKPGDEVCTQCHSLEPPLERFMTLQVKDYATPEHHFHPQEDDSARCVACHMPDETYMVVDPRRDHSMRIPRPDLTLSIGAPNACDDCHRDKGTQWSVDACLEWYGDTPPPHFGEVLHAIRAGEPAALDSVAELFADENTPGIVRATAVVDLTDGRWGPAGTQLALGALDDEDPMVRSAALEGLAGLPPQALVPLVAPYLDDPVRLVRCAAARALVGPPEEFLDASTRPRFEAGLAEYFDAQAANADMPGSHLNVGYVHGLRGEPRKAEASYRRAIRLDQDFLPAIFNLATLLSTAGKAEEAERLLVAAIERHPKNGELHYSLGLLRAELRRLEASAESLRLAAHYLPERARVHYNLGLALQQTGQVTDAAVALHRAAELEPRNPDSLYALSLLYLDQGQLEQALDWANKLCEALPQAPGPRQLVEEISRRLAAGR